MTAPVMRTVGYVAGNDTGNTTTKTVNLPTHAAGETLYIALVDDAPSQTFTIPGDWSRVIDTEAVFPTNNVSTFLLIKKVAGGSEPASINIGTSISERSVWIAFAVQGDNGLDGAYASNAGGSSATAQTAAITTTVADTLVIGLVPTDGVSTPHGTPSGYSRLAEISFTSAPSLSVNYQTVASPSTIAAQNSSLNVSEQWRGFTFAIKPVGGTTYNQSLSGTVTSSGAVAKTVTKVIAGAIASSGVVRKTILHLLTGTVTSAGHAGKVLGATLAGVISMSGNLVTIVQHHYTQILEGSISPSGSLQRTTQKVLTGVITSAGSLAKLIFKALTGVISSTGSLAREFTTAPFRQKPPSTIYRQDNLSFLITAPAWGGSAYFNDVSSAVQSYEHSSSAMGGFYSANLNLRLSLSELEDWLENSVGRQVQVKGRANTIAWEGIINRVSVNVGGYNMTVGPYTDICNKVKITYSIFLQLGGGNATGIRVVSDYIHNTKSQQRYGILEKNFSTGGIDTSAVDELQAMLLARYAYPLRSEDLNLPGEAIRPHFDIKVECIGYMTLFEKYTYNSTTTGTQNLSAKLAAIIAAEPNGLFSSTLTTNTIQVPAYENDDSEAWGLIKELVLQGDATLNRYSLGVYENRRVIYQPVSNQIVYIRPFREGISVIQDSTGGLLQPWQIRPGSYIWVSDLMPGKPLSSNLNDDRRVIYADTVQYRMPDGLVINGAHYFRVEQRLAQLGISGLG